MDFSSKIGYSGSLKFGSYYVQYVPVSQPFNHAQFEVLEGLIVHCTWSNNW